MYSKLLLTLMVSMGVMAGGDRNTIVVENTYITPTGVEHILTWQERVVLLLEEADIDLDLADRIIQCESSGNPKAEHYNPPRYKDGVLVRAGSYDIGLWQINDVHGLTIEERKDPVISTKMAIKLIKSQRSWSHWVCYEKEELSTLTVQP